MTFSRSRIGVLIIGQTPRADLLTPLEHLNNACELVIRGALDGVRQADLPATSDSSYPLITLLQDGTLVTVDERFLTPLLQTAIDGLEGEGVAATLLLCAGPFRGLTSSRPLIRPFQLATLVLRSLGQRHILVVIPTNNQRQPALAKWTEAGLKPVILSVEDKPFRRSLEDWLVDQSRTHADLTLVLDYVGQPVEVLQYLQARVEHPVVDLGHLAINVTKAMLALRNFAATPNEGSNV